MKGKTIGTFLFFGALIIGIPLTLFKCGHPGTAKKQAQPTDYAVKVHFVLAGDFHHVGVMLCDWNKAHCQNSAIPEKQKLTFVNTTAWVLRKGNIELSIWADNAGDKRRWFYFSSPPPPEADGQVTVEIQKDAGNNPVLIFEGKPLQRYDF